MKSGFLAFWLSGFLAFWLSGSIVLLAAPALGQNVDLARADRAADVLARPVPVTAADIGDRPYRVLGQVDTYVGKPLWQAPPSEEKVFRELWERARRLGADAVVHASYGSPQCEFFRSCGGRQATGQAVHFLTPAELAVARTR